jgi:hypothetical protein
MNEAARFVLRRVLVAVLMLVTAVVGVTVGHATSGSVSTAADDVLSSSAMAVSDAPTGVVALLAAEGVTPPGAEDLFGCDASCIAECGLLGLTCSALLIALLVFVRGPVLAMSWGVPWLSRVGSVSGPLSRATPDVLSLHQLSVSRT